VTDGVISIPICSSEPRSLPGAAEPTPTKTQLSPQVSKNIMLIRNHAANIQF
jgi:hypothetical protein